MINHMYRRGAQVFTLAQRRRARLRPRQPGRAGADAQPGAAALLRAGARRVPPPGASTVRLARAGRHGARRRRSCSRTARCSRSTRRGARRAEPISAGRVFVDGKGIGDISDIVLRDRRHLSQDGLLLAVLAHRSAQRRADRRAGLHRPRRVRRGRAGARTSRRRARWSSRRSAIAPESRTDSLEVKEEVRKALRRYLSKTLDRRPVVVPFVMEM